MDCCHTEDKKTENKDHEMNHGSHEHHGDSHGCGMDQDSAKNYLKRF